MLTKSLVSESTVTIFEVTLRSERMANLKGTNGNYLR